MTETIRRNTSSGSMRESQDSAPVKDSGTKISGSWRKEPPENFASKSLGYQTIWYVQQAQIKPPALKLLLLNIAIHVNSDTGLAFPGLGLLATECSLSQSHTKRLLKEAKDSGILTVAAQGGGRTSNRYRFNLKELSQGYSASGPPFQECNLAKLRAPMNEPGSTMIPVHGQSVSQPTDKPAAGSIMSKEPHRPQRPQSLGDGGQTTTAGSATPTPWVAPKLPPELNAKLFAELVSTGPEVQARVNALAKEAFELSEAGHDLNAMAKLTVQRGYKSWCLPPKVHSNKKSLEKSKSPDSGVNQEKSDRWGGY
jgi:hypothetical protein